MKTFGYGGIEPERGNKVTGRYSDKLVLKIIIYDQWEATWDSWKINIPEAKTIVKSSKWDWPRVISVLDLINRLNGTFSSLILLLSEQLSCLLHTDPGRCILGRNLLWRRFTLIYIYFLLNYFNFEFNFSSRSVVFFSCLWIQSESLEEQFSYFIGAFAVASCQKNHLFLYFDINGHWDDIATRHSNLNAF